MAKNHTISMKSFYLVIIACAVLLGTVSVTKAADEQTYTVTFLKIEVFPDRIVFTLPGKYEKMPDKEFDEKAIRAASAYILSNKAKFPDAEYDIYRKGRILTLYRK